MLTQTFFQGNFYKHSYFEGWYFRHQVEGFTLAMIPSFHRDSQGDVFANLQIITDDRAWSIPFPSSCFFANPDQLHIRLGDNIFSARGVCLNLATDDLRLTGRIEYGPFAPPPRDIMGPFTHIPGMECYHRVFSYFHALRGSVHLNSKRISFDRGKGYIEGDRGRSFPSCYLWTQSFLGHSSLFLSAARIPFCGRGFDGCVGALWHRGREYRFATYMGARICHMSPRMLIIKQGGLQIAAIRLGNDMCSLKAPAQGEMKRMIQEMPAGPVHYYIYKNGDPILDFRSMNAAFEWEGGKKRN